MITLNLIWHTRAQSHYGVRATAGYGKLQAVLSALSRNKSSPQLFQVRDTKNEEVKTPRKLSGQQICLMAWLLLGLLTCMPHKRKPELQLKCYTNMLTGT
jgi:hypothetical protein